MYVHMFPYKSITGTELTWNTRIWHHISLELIYFSFLCWIKWIRISFKIACIGKKILLWTWYVFTRLNIYVYFSCWITKRSTLKNTVALASGYLILFVPFLTQVRSYQLRQQGLVLLETSSSSFSRIPWSTRLSSTPTSKQIMKPVTILFTLL